MEIKRKFEILVATNRRFIIRQSPLVKKISCAECGEPMLSTEQVADVFGIKQRNIFQIVESNKVHFVELENNKVIICLSSLAIVLENQSQKNHNFQPYQVAKPIQ